MRHTGKAAHDNSRVMALAPPSPHVSIHCERCNLCASRYFSALATFMLTLYAVTSLAGENFVVVLTTPSAAGAAVLFVASSDKDAA
ncbi:MAG: hypothetical protein R3268_00510 [Acidiferrobacterales bacterium]|nr:hypothetical protein [Acidiferrobacterales bacterium]